MRASAVPDILAAEAAIPSAGLANAEVRLGDVPGLSSGDYFCAGVVDPGATNATSAATSTVTWHGIQLSEGFDEAGNVAIAIWSKNGSSDLAEVINNAYAVLDAHQAYLAAHYTNNQFLGVSGLWDYHLASTELQTFPDPAGCTAYLLVQYAFQALTI